jgi:acetyl-CoA C-acetyltransferase
MMHKKRQIPVLVGVGQLVNRNPDGCCDPLDYMVECARLAEQDTGVGDILSKIDSLSMVNVISRNYTNEPVLLAEMLKASPKEILTTPIGATAPQSLTNRLCQRIADGESDIGLICGAEAFYSSKNGLPEKFEFNSEGVADTVKLYGDTRASGTDEERKYGLTVPNNIYPLFANAYRKAQGLSLEECMQQNAQISAQYAAVAADNEYAWFRDGKSAQEIAAVTETNRMINYPYTKFMNAIMNVDQAAALLVMSEERADALGVSQDKRVYLIGTGEAYEKWFVSDRVNYYSAPGLKVALDNAFDEAGISQDQVDIWDLYNCFPIAALLAKDALGLSESTVPTITGGLPYFGGAGNNYSLHSICRMVEGIRGAPHKKGLVHSLSWYMSKYAVGIYSGVRPDTFARRDTDEYARTIDEEFPNVSVLERANGVFEIETYTVAMARDGRPESAVIIARNEQHQRLFAHNNHDIALLKSMTTCEPIGKKARVKFDDATAMNQIVAIL